MFRIVALTAVCALAPLSACESASNPSAAGATKSQIEIEGKPYTLKVEADRVKVLDGDRQVAKVKDKGDGKLKIYGAGDAAEFKGYRDGVTVKGLKRGEQKAELKALSPAQRRALHEFLQRRK